MKRHLVGLADNQILPGYRYRACYYIVWTAAICKVSVGSSAVAAVGNKRVEVVAVARKNKRLEICEAVPLVAHTQDYSPHVGMPRLHSENAKVSPTLGLMEPCSRVEARPEVGPCSSHSVGNVVRSTRDNNPPLISRKKRLVAAPVVQHHIVVNPRHAVAPKFGLHPRIAEPDWQVDK